MEQVPVTGLLHTFLFSQMKQSSRLLIKTAILMPEAKEGEVTIVEVESMGFNKTKVDWMMTIILILFFVFSKLRFALFLCRALLSR